MKTVFVNIAVLCMLWVFVHLALILGDQVKDALTAQAASEAPPSLDGHDWAERHIAEFREQDYRYLSYVGWRRYPFAGETINIDERGVRATVDRTPDDTGESVFFFGGSTMWGTGVSDAYTIPSYFASKTRDYLVTNYGEAAYTAHQGLETLIKLLQSGERPDVVVFYDGVNEVRYKCLKEHDWYSHGWEHRYDRRIGYYDSVFSFEYALGPLRSAAARLREAIGSGAAEDAKTYDCRENLEKAERIATALVADWEIAKMLVDSYGGRFYAFLQPVSYFSRTRLDHLPESEELRAQYELIYPLVRSKAAGARHVHDVTDVFDHDEYIYLDYAHVGPSGNRYAAERMLAIIAGDAEPPPSLTD